MKTAAALVTGALWLAANVGHAQTCQPSDTVNTCVATLSSSTARAAREAAAADATVAAAAAVKASNAGVDTAAAGTASATKNFLPLLRFAGLVGDGVTTDDGLVAFDVNFPFPTPQLDDAQLQIILNPAPTLYKPLADTLTALGNDALKGDLEDGLSDTDDLRVAFTYGKNGKNLGRHLKEYQDLFTALVRTALDGAPAAASGEQARGPFDAFIRDWFRRAESATPPAIPEDLIDSRDLRFEQITNAPLRDELMEHIAAFALLQKQREEDLTASLRANNLHRFADLVANQPQLYVQAKQRMADDLIGPDETTVELTWERGLASIGDFRKKAGTNCTTEQSAACLTAFDEYVTANATAITNADRLAVSLSYSKIDRYSLDRPQDGVAVNVPGSHKIAASFTFGRSIAPERTEGQRVDFLLKYEDSDDNNVLNDRTIAGFTYSRKAGDSVFPVTVLYSNEGELAGDTGNEITVNFGMAFDMIGKKER